MTSQLAGYQLCLITVYLVRERDVNKHPHTRVYIRGHRGAALQSLTRGEQRRLSRGVRVYGAYVYFFI